MDRLRLPFLLAAAFFLLLALLMELAAADALTRWSMGTLKTATPGIAIGYLAIFDGLLLYNLFWMGLGYVAPSVSGRLQGIVTLVLAILALIGVVAMAFAAFTLLMLMLALLMSVPFGTIAYLAKWANFATDPAAVTLGLAMMLKLLFCLFLVLAQQRFLQNKGLIVLVAVSLGLTWVVGFVHAFLPGFLVSIGDAAAALVIAVIGAVWILLLVVGSVVAIVKAVFSLGRTKTAAT